MKRRNNSGFSVLEVVIASAIMAVLIGVVYALLHGAMSTDEKERVHVELEALARDKTDQISRELLKAGRSTLFPLNPVDSNTVSFQINTGFQGGAIVYGPVITYSGQIDPHETDNDEDDDNDGLIDEWQVTRTEGGDTTVFVSNVRENGFRVSRPAGVDTVTVTLELMKMDISKTTPIERRAEISVRMRN